MSQVLLEDPTSQLAPFVEQVSRGKEVIILRDNTPVAKIVLMPEKKSTEKPVPHFGNARVILIYIADDFDALLGDFKDYM